MDNKNRQSNKDKNSVYNLSDCMWMAVSEDGRQYPKCSKQQCCGCSACVNACPQKCISMKSNSEGFAFPQIDTSKCVSCGICVNACPFNNNNLIELESLPIVLAAKSRNSEFLLHSSSGGIFPEIANYILRSNGVVFGARMSEDNRNVYISYIEHANDLKNLQGSKYIQAEVGNSFLQAKQFLLNGQKVLFSGTTCQIAGLKSFLGKEYDNLICIDVICHGVPSPLMWHKYCDYVYAKYGRQIDRINFRNKKYSWQDFGMKMTIGEKDEFEFHFKNPYSRLFNSNLCLRSSCYHCKSKGLNTRSDISLGDFWNIEKVIPEFSDEKGISMVLLNTSKGKKFFQDCSWSSIDISKQYVTYDQACACNPAVFKSLSVSEDRKGFFDDLKKHNFLYIKNKYTSNTWRTRFKSILIKLGIMPRLRKGKRFLKKHFR